MGEGGIGCGIPGSWRVDGFMIEIPGFDCSRIGILKTLIPVICNVMIINDMNPGEGLGGCGKIWRGVYLAILLTVGFYIGAESSGYINVDEIPEEQHKRCLERWDPFCHMPKASDGQRVGKWAIREIRLDTARSEEGKLSVCGLTDSRSCDKKSGLIVRYSILVSAGRMKVG